MTTHNNKSFKDYYQDPDFKERHKQKILEKITCECGTITAKCNLSHHKKTKKHLQWKENKLKKDKENIIGHLEKEIKNLKEIVKSLNE